MTLSRANTVLSIWILLVGIASFGNAESTIKDDLLKEANQFKLLAESTRDQLQNDTENKESKGTIAEQFGLYAEQIDIIIKLLKSMDEHNDDDQKIIQLCKDQLNRFRILHSEIFQVYSPEGKKLGHLYDVVKNQTNIATAHLDYFKLNNLPTIQKQFETFVVRLQGVIHTQRVKPSPMGSAYARKATDIIESEVIQITKQLKTLTEKYPKL